MSATVECLSAEQSVAAIANFTNGRLKNYDGVKFQLHQTNGKNRQHRKRKLKAETGRLEYLSKSTEQNSSHSGLKYMVGVFDTETKKLKLLPADIFSLKPHWPEDGKSEVESEKENWTNRQKMDDLISAFGSSKKKKAMMSRKNNEISVGGLQDSVGSAVDVAMSQYSLEDLKTKESHPSEESPLIPIHNKDATRPEDVYLLDDIVSPQDREALLTPAQKFINSTKGQIEEWSENGKYAFFVIDQLGNLPLDPARRAERSCVIMYLQYMISLYGLKVSELKRKDIPLPEDIPPSVKVSLLQQFTLKTINENSHPMRSMPARCKDKLLFHILALCLRLEGFVLNVGLILKDLKLGQQRATLLLRCLGCKVQSQKRATGPGATGKMEVKTATLPLPLKFPEMTFSSQKTKR